RGIRDQRRHRFAFVGSESGDVHEPGDLRVRAGFGDHHAAVGVTDEQYGAALRGDRALRHRDVVSQRQRGVLHDHYVVPVLLQDPYTAAQPEPSTKPPWTRTIFLIAELSVAGMAISSNAQLRGGCSLP